jgi:hypothetical protein
VGVALTTLWAQPKDAVVDNVLKVAALTTGIVLGLFALGRFRRPVSSTAAMAGLLGGAAVVGAVFAATPLAWLWYAPLGTLTTVAVALLADRVVPGPPNGGESKGPGGEG